MKDLLRLVIANENGLTYSKEFRLDTTLVSIVNESLQHQLYESPITADDLCLVCVRRGCRLTKTQTLAQAEVANLDQILLVPHTDDDRCFLPLLTGGVPIAEAESDPDLELAASGAQSPAVTSPDHDDIASATSALEQRNFNRSPSTAGSLPLMQAGGSALGSGMVPVLVSLVEAAQRILCLHKNAARILAVVKAGAAVTASNYPPAQPALVQQLVEMGFSSSQAERALSLTFNTVSDAMDWLLNHGDEPEQTAAPPPPPAAEQVEVSEDSDLIETLSVSQTLELFRKYSRAQFQPNHHLKIKFLEMGFDDVSVMDALRVSSNDESQTLEILLNRSSSFRLSELSSDDLPSLDPECTLYKVLMAHPSVQLALTNPSTLFGFLSILDNPQSLAQWQTQSPDFGSLVRLITALYYENCEEPMLAAMVEEAEVVESV